MVLAAAAVTPKTGRTHEVAARQLAPAYGLGNLLQFHFKFGHAFSPW
jgi:hypothetical protein